MELLWNEFDRVYIEFGLNKSINQFELSHLDFFINASSTFPDGKSKFFLFTDIEDVFNFVLFFSVNSTVRLLHIANNFSTPLGLSYHCTRVQKLDLTGSENSTELVGFVDISHIQFEAFHSQQNDKFSTAHDCDAIDTPDIVPIAVGCALAGLIAVVLIAYLVARRRSQARGYHSM